MVVVQQIIEKASPRPPPKKPRLWTPNFCGCLRSDEELDMMMRWAQLREIQLSVTGQCPPFPLRFRIASIGTGTLLAYRNSIWSSLLHVQPDVAFAHFENSVLPPGENCPGGLSVERLRRRKKSSRSQWLHFISVGFRSALKEGEPL